MILSLRSDKRSLFVSANGNEGRGVAYSKNSTTKHVSLPGSNLNFVRPLAGEFGEMTSCNSLASIKRCWFVYYIEERHRHNHECLFTGRSDKVFAVKIKRQEKKTRCVNYARNRDITSITADVLSLYLPPSSC